MITYADQIWDYGKAFFLPIHSASAIWSTHGRDIFAGDQQLIDAIFAVAYDTAARGSKFIFPTTRLRRMADYFADPMTKLRIAGVMEKDLSYNLLTAGAATNPYETFPPINVVAAALVDETRHDCRMYEITNVNAAVRAVIFAPLRGYPQFAPLVWRDGFAAEAESTAILPRGLRVKERRQTPEPIRKIDWVISCNGNVVENENLVMQSMETGTPIFIDSISGRGNNPIDFPEMLRVRHYPPQLGRRSLGPDDFPAAVRRGPKSFSLVQMGTEDDEGKAHEMTGEEMERVDDDSDNV